MTKFSEWTLYPDRESRKNSGRFLRRADFGNACLPFSAFLRGYVRARLGGTDTVNFLRPLARRRLITLRPPGVAMRARKPWVRLRLILLG